MAEDNFVKKNPRVQPVLKWVGGKRQLLDSLGPLLPKQIERYCEPFVGGGALLFALQPQEAFINDVSEELINVYRVIRDDVEALIEELQKHPNEHNHFYWVRDWDRERGSYAQLSNIAKAARMLYLNKTCYNGLFRVNASGQFNTPFGRYRNPNIVNAEVLRAVSAYLGKSKVEMTCGDYATRLKHLPAGTFVYLDPPYDPVSPTANFTSYARGGFDRAEQMRLREQCELMDARGIKFMLSNSATEFIKTLYSRYDITLVSAKRAINSKSAARGDVAEVVVRNYTSL